MLGCFSSPCPSHYHPLTLHLAPPQPSLVPREQRAAGRGEAATTMKLSNTALVRYRQEERIRICKKA
ncbi:hypothetical protein E2C01_028935 [Portunus trituberculatus]|uniref:Uncharacterized protein n=1 Tax=Portunus trituberculatus TaxID=210409 RepID=A0A5B7EM04_PORTR|nr:hypothetical protein [Portunus trituberculatus]